MVNDATESTGECRVRLWFGPHLLHDYRAGAAAAEAYIDAIGKCFGGLRVTIDSEVTEDMTALPCEQLWSLTP